MPTPRSGLAAGVLNGSLIVVGGENDNTSVGTVEAYDASTDTWTTLTNMPTARVFLAAGTVNNTLYVFGGGVVSNLFGALTTNEAYTVLPCSGRG